LAAWRNKQIIGILPLIWVKSLLFGNVFASLPFQDYGGISSDHPEAARLLLNKALQLRDEYGASCLDMRHREPTIEGEGTPRRDKATLTLDISEGSESLWNSLSGKVRNQVRKAQKSGLTTQLGGIELLEEFYPVFAANMRDLGSPVHHCNFFRQVFMAMGDNACLLAVRDGKRVIGGLIGIFHKDNVIVPWASSLREFFAKCPNNLLYWDAIQLACDRGCKQFDFGRSSFGSGTYNFKLQWGAKPIPLHWQLFFRKEQVSITHPSEDAKMQMAAKVWSRLPLPLTVLLGPTIRKNLVN
jgi:serine/alanine adding enzyme